MLYPSPIQLSHVYDGPIAHGVLPGGPEMSNANGGFVSVLLTHLLFIIILVYLFIYFSLAFPMDLAIIDVI